VVGGVKLLCDVSRGGVRLLVQLVDRAAVFTAFHELAHAGTRATKRLIAARVMWRGLVAGCPSYYYIYMSVNVGFSKTTNVRQ
jgi:hypothetical protein